jgi:transposase
MPRRKKDPLREITESEREWLTRMRRSLSEPASHVVRAQQLLAIADGHSYTEAARLSGRKSNDAVSQLVSRFNREGVAAIVPRHEGGPAIQYGDAEQERILQEVQRTPEPERDGTATWSLKTLCQVLRAAEEGLPTVSEDTIRTTLLTAGYSWQKNRSWCKTGEVQRKRKTGVVTVTDPDSTPKKT